MSETEEIAYTVVGKIVKQFKKDKRLRYWADVRTSCLLYCKIMQYNTTSEELHKWRKVETFILERFHANTLKSERLAKIK